MPSRQQQDEQAAVTAPFILELAQLVGPNVPIACVHGADTPRRLFGSAAVKTCGRVFQVPSSPSHSVIHLAWDDIAGPFAHALAAAGMDDFYTTIQQRCWAGVYAVLDEDAAAAGRPAISFFAAAPHICAAVTATRSPAVDPDSLVPLLLEALLHGGATTLPKCRTLNVSIRRSVCTAGGKASVAAKAAAMLPDFMPSRWTFEKAHTDPDGFRAAYHTQLAAAGAASVAAKAAAGLPMFMPSGWTFALAEADPAAFWAACDEQSAKANKGLPTCLPRGWSMPQAEADPDGAWLAFWELCADVQRDRLAKGLPPFTPKGWTNKQAEANPAGAWEAYRVQQTKRSSKGGKARAVARGQVPFTEEEELLIKNCMKANGDWEEGYGGTSGLLPDIQHKSREQIIQKRNKMAMAIRKAEGVVLPRRYRWTDADLQKLKSCMTAEGDWQEGYGGVSGLLPKTGTLKRHQILDKRVKLAAAIRAAMQGNTGTKKRKRSA